MKKLSWRFWFGLGLLSLSALLYGVHYMLFRDAHHIFLYLLGDIAFVFVEVLLVTMVLHHVLNRWEQRSHLRKLNMVIETFFSECGKQLVCTLAGADSTLNQIRPQLLVSPQMSEAHYRQALKAVRAYKSSIVMERVDLGALRSFLRTKRYFLVNLLQNPTLLEHEQFTDALMALFHLTEELSARDMSALSSEELDHTRIDMQRAFDRLLQQWLCYMHYIRRHYPYFYAFALRTNPFERQQHTPCTLPAS